MLFPFHELEIKAEFSLPEKDEFRERSRFGGFGFAQENDLLFPDRALHGDKADIALRNLRSYAAHVADNALDFVVLAFKEIKAVLYTLPAQRLKFLAEEGLVLSFGDIISKHHEHEARKGGKGLYSAPAGRG